jgi:CMP-N-acetylneuraminic acid synthetase
MKIIAMIPARLGSQRLKQKNLFPLQGKPLIAHAIEKCLKVKLFNEVWVNSESEIIGEQARQHGAEFHLRPAELANNQATSEQFIYEFLQHHPCDYLVQVHSIAPLLSQTDIENFLAYLNKHKPDVLLSAINEQIECALDDQPVNFTFAQKENSQDLKPLQRITWSITGWKSSSYINTFEEGKTATYNGTVKIAPVNQLSGHVIKTLEDIKIAEALWPLVHS